ncbi:MAG: hypothetical protein DME65_01245 [Verrucomicrobia bacterium]|nr:MAG: hypothetical protein DME65_01245 [Verrucomicrobiota bacterium]
MSPASLHTLLAHSIDYAGMFPPCSLGLETALQNQADYVRSPDAWMLGAFVLSAERFDATRQLLSQFDAQHPLRVAALGPKSANADAFLEALDSTEAATRSFSRHNVDLISISHLEMFLPDDVDLASLQEAKSIVGDLPVYWEAPSDRAEQTIALLAEFNSDADSPTFGYKLRTGGVTAEAFPTSMQIAKALVTPSTHQVPIKFTAGLHHPLRQYRKEVQTKMHGFLNVLGAAALAAEYHWDTNQTEMMLDDENVDSFSFAEDFFAWREWRIEIKRLEYRRRFIVSFGSCSFDEPREDLRALGFL